MGKAFYLVVAPEAARWLCRRLGAAPFRWTYIGADDGRRAVVEQALGPTAEYISIAPCFQGALQALRQPYIDYIGGLSQQYASLDWWAGCLAEKNPFISQVFLQACYLRAGLDLLSAKEDGDRPLVIVAESRSLRLALTRNLNAKAYPVYLREGWLSGLRSTVADVARACLHRGYFLLTGGQRIALARYVHRAHRAPALLEALRSGQPLTLVHSWADRRSLNLENGRFSDPEFGEVGHYLQERGCRVVTVPYVLRAMPYGKTIRFLRGAREPFLVPHACLSLGDVIAVAFKTAVAVPRRRSCPYFADMDVSDLIREDQRRDWVSYRKCNVLLFSSLVRRWRKAGLNIERFIYTFENHAWERVLCHAMRQHYPQARLIACQPAAESLFLLNQFISAQERAIVPLPHLVIAHGAYTARLLRESGYPEGLVVAGGSVRYRHLIEGLGNGNSRLPVVRSQPVVLVTPSISPEETGELIRKVCQAFPVPSDLQIVIKFHPSTPWRRIERHLRLKGLPTHFRVSEQWVSDLVRESDVLVYTGSSTCLEALAQGMVPVHVVPDCILDWDPLLACPELRLVAHTPAELAACVAEAIQLRQSDTTDRLKLGREFLRDFLGAVDEPFLRLFLH